MTARQTFQQNDGAVSFLREVLTHPIVIQALAIVEQETSVQKATPIPGVDYGMQMAINGAEALGASTFKKKLLSLIEKPIRIETNPNSAYVEQAIEKMVKTGVYTEEQARKAYEESLNQ